MCELPKRKIALEMNKDPIETTGQDRRSAGRMKAIYSLLSCPAFRGILPPCFMAILVIYFSFLKNSHIALCLQKF
jgi:hypothetical protein